MSIPLKRKPSVSIVYTGEGKGKTSAGIGLVSRALGHGDRVAFVQFIKAWHVSEHTFFDTIKPIYGDNFMFYKGGRGFYNAGDLSAKGVSEDEHKHSARATFDIAYEAATRGDYDLVVCDEINNAVHDGLLEMTDLTRLLDDRKETTSVCLTGRDFPTDLVPKIDIVTNMQQIRHHYDDGFVANEGIDY